MYYHTMMTQSLSSEGVDALNDLVGRVYQELSNVANARFFVASQTENPNATTDEDKLIDVILDTVDDNRIIIDSIAGSSVVYAIWVRTPSTGESLIRYIGHVVDKGARMRIINHFVRKDPRTGAQLANVRAALAAGLAVGVSFVAIDPPALRLYIEEVLIRQHRLIWNKKSADHRRGKQIV